MLKTGCFSQFCVERLRCHTIRAFCSFSRFLVSLIKQSSLVHFLCKYFQSFKSSFRNFSYAVKGTNLSRIENSLFVHPSKRKKPTKNLKLLFSIFFVYLIAYALLLSIFCIVTLVPCLLPDQ